jgi:hypothetical protein
MSDSSSWPVVDLNQQTARFHQDLLRGQILGHELIDEDDQLGLDEFGNRRSDGGWWRP